MEKYAKKAKITSSSVGEGLSLNKWKLLMISATIVYTIAFFSPWIWERYSFLVIMRELQPEIYPLPRLPREGWFWSFMAVIHTTGNDYEFLPPFDYWFDLNNRFYRREFHGWLWIFIFQILTILAALITIQRKNMDKRLGTSITTVLSVTAPILCIYQRCAQSSYGMATSRFFVGFWLAIISVILFFVSYQLVNKYGREHKEAQL